jgi:6-phosphogluconolactonase
MRTLHRASHELTVCADAAELAREAARRFAELATAFTADTGRFNVALSGGSTPKAMFSILADAPCADSLPWGAIHFFWGDERCVPPDDAASNYRMARESLFDKVPIPPENIHRIPADDAEPERAAARYAETLTNFFNLAPNQVPCFDLIFLGMGADGHTASLFPGTAALGVHDRIVVANYVEKFQSHRITFTAHTINSARHILFLVAGADKAPALRQVLDGPRESTQYPSQLIEATNGDLRWLLDEAAANQLAR